MKKNRALFGNKKQGGFTLIELLIVIAVMAILSTVVFVALNPLARFEDSRNNRRGTDVIALMSAIKLAQIDNGGNYYTAITDAADDAVYMIGTCTDTSGFNCNFPPLTLETECIDFTNFVDTGYLPSVPVDPNSNANGASAEISGYYFVKNANGSLTVGACFEETGSAEEPREIYVSR